MATPITLNGDSSIQPSNVKEDLLQKVITRVSIKGNLHRYWEAQKKQVTLTYSAITNAQFLVLMSYLANQGNPVTYSNPNSNFTFTGFATTSTAEYLPGNNFLRHMTITIDEQ